VSIPSAAPPLFSQFFFPSITPISAWGGLLLLLFFPPPFSYNFSPPPLSVPLNVARTEDTLFSLNSPNYKRCPASNSPNTLTSQPFRSLRPLSGSTRVIFFPYPGTKPYGLIIVFVIVVASIAFFETPASRFFSPFLMRRIPLTFPSKWRTSAP